MKIIKTVLITLFLVSLAVIGMMVGIVVGIILRPYPEVKTVDIRRDYIDTRYPPWMYERLDIGSNMPVPTPVPTPTR